METWLQLQRAATILGPVRYLTRDNYFLRIHVFHKKLGLATSTESFLIGFLLWYLKLPYCLEVEYIEADRHEKQQSSLSMV